MSFDQLIIRNARQNNLKGISLSLPHDHVIAITGVSGSGKSSLAFETIFAEGQWRFIESLSTYARLFLEKLDRPMVDEIKNIRPAIALEQRNPVRGSRSTVGTLTEVFDYFRLIYAKAGEPHCPRCGEELRHWDPSAIRAHIIEHHDGQKAHVLFNSPLDAQELMRRGFMRAYVQGRALDLAGPETPPAPPYRVVMDRLVVRDEPRLADSIEGAFKEGAGELTVAIVDGPEVAYRAGLTCSKCDITLADPSPILFSFNHPVGACPECKGFGNVLKYAHDLIVPDQELTIAEGAVEPWQKPAALWWHKQCVKGAPKSGLPLDVPYKALSAAHRALLFKGDKNFHGIDDFFEELEGKRYKLHVRVFLSRYRSGVICPACHGARLRPEALAFRIGGQNISELAQMPISRLVDFFKDLSISPFRRDVAKEPLRQVTMKLGFLDRVGLGYLTLSREARTLSGGEYQRVSLSNQLASKLTGTLYVLDEPTVGLHKRDTDRVAQIMRELAEAGNTVIVVEHDMGIIAGADWVVELGPGGGHRGGDVVFSGPMERFMQSDTITARYMRGEETVARRGRKRTPTGWVELSGCQGHNLQSVTLRAPLGVLCAVSGVSGSGKTSLVVGTFYRALSKHHATGTDSPLPFDELKGAEKIKSIKLIDQSPIGRSPRSNPMTYLKLFDPIRKLFSKEPRAVAHGFGPGFFSFNLQGGRCEDCKGEGYQKLEMYFFEDLYVKCESCGGKRYGPEALSVKYRGKGIDEVLELTVDEAEGFFADDAQISNRLALMRDIGLGYLRLGQPATTLSGGEAQRLKVCAELGTGRLSQVLYILDEPTVGLHSRDVSALLNILGRLVDAGNAVLVIEHNLDVLRAADWLIDLGPEGGSGGGRILYAGPPEGIVDTPESLTAGVLYAQ